MSNRSSIFPCSFVHAGGTLDLQQMEDFDINTANERSEIIPGGAVDRAHIGIASAAPEATLGTRDLATALAAVSGSLGLPITGQATFRRQTREDGSTFKTGLSHNTWVAQKGFLRPTTLSATQDDTQGAKLTLGFMPTWDQMNDPFLPATGVDFSLAPQPAFASRFFLGPVFLNGVEMGGITDTNVEYGINYVQKSFGGDPFAKLGSIVTRIPIFSFTTTDDVDMAALGLFGNSITSELAFYYWKGIDSSTRVAKTATEHVKVACSGGNIGADNIAVSGNDDGTQTVNVMPKGVISSAVGAAIP